MTRFKFACAIALTSSVIASGAAVAAETGRIQRKPPDAAEAARIASETVMNDSLLKKGDIVVTDRGPLVFHGVGSDGYTYEFSPLPIGPRSPSPADRAVPEGPLLDSSGGRSVRY